MSSTITLPHAKPPDRDLNPGEMHGNVEALTTLLNGRIGTDNLLPEQIIIPSIHLDEEGGVANQVLTLDANLKWGPRTAQDLITIPPTVGIVAGGAIYNPGIVLVASTNAGPIDVSNNLACWVNVVGTGKVLCILSATVNAGSNILWGVRDNNAGTPGPNSGMFKLHDPGNGRITIPIYFTSNVGWHDYYWQHQALGGVTVQTKAGQASATTDPGPASMWFWSW